MLHEEDRPERSTSQPTNAAAGGAQSMAGK